MRKISFIAENMYPFTMGGQEKRVYDYAKNLKNHYCVHVVTMKQWEGDDEFEESGVRHVSICSRMSIYNANGKRNGLASLRLGIKTFFYVLRSEDDILDINVFPYFPLIFAKCAVFFKRSKPVIVGVWAEYWGREYWQKYDKYLWWLGMALEYVSYHAIDVHLTCSRFTKRRLKQAFARSKRPITVLAPTYIDADLIDSVPQQEKIYDLIFYGRIIAHKHVEDVVIIVERLVRAGYDARALIIGDGPAKEDILRFIREKGLDQHINVENFVDDYRELVTKIKSSRVMIQPSEREGFGITVVEAHRCGLPVFAVRYPDNASAQLITDGKNGFVCEDANDLYRAVQEFFLSSHRDHVLEQMSHFAKISTQQYELQHMQKSISRFYEEVGNICEKKKNALLAS